MKNILVGVCLFLLATVCYAQSGIYAGAYKKWVKKQIVKSKEPVFFKAFTYTGFSLLQNDGEMEYYLQQYKKGSTHIILLVSQIKDVLSYTIEDVVEIKYVGRKDNIQSGTCLWNGSNNAKVFVLEKNIKGKKVNTKAWYADTDKLHFASIPAKGINCIVEGAD
jgi:hypothetical protein